MLIYAVIFGTIVLAYYRGRHRERFWSSMAIEAGFLTLFLHYGFLEGYWQSHVTYPLFLLGWIVPIIAACLVADGAGRVIAWRERKRR